MFSERTNWRLAQNRLTQAIAAARAKGAELLDLTASNPTRVGLEYDAPAILGALASERSLDYDPQAKGLLTARESVAEYYRVEHEVNLDPERIILTASTSEGYSYVFRLLCNSGDELLVPKPSYPLFEFLADLQDVKLVPYPLIYDHGWQMDFPSLEKSVTPRTRGVVVVHPNNPTGSYVQSREFGPLNEFCLAHQLALIVDEVFLDYPLDSQPRLDQAHRSFAGNRDVLTFTLSGLSKVSALPQMKVAWIATSGPESGASEAILPQAIVSEAVARLEVIADTYLSMNAPVQWATPVLLEQRRHIQRQLIDRVCRNLSELDRQLAEQKTCERLSVEGGWYAVVRVPVTRSDEDLAIELAQEKHVLVHPGHFYDFPSDGYMILSLIAPVDEFSEGVRRLLSLLRS
jgi:alanine-synthesizing transaminase